MWYVCNLCVLVACGVWNYVSVYVVLLFTLIEMSLYAHVYVYGCLNIFVLVLVYVSACVSGYFLCELRCVSQRVTTSPRRLQLLAPPRFCTLGPDHSEYVFEEKPRRRSLPLRYAEECFGIAVSSRKAALPRDVRLA